MPAGHCGPAGFFIDSVSEKGSDPLERVVFHSFIAFEGEDQTPFRTGPDAHITPT